MQTPFKVELPEEPVTLTPAEIRALAAPKALGQQSKLSTLRHDVNNAITAISGWAQLLRENPELAGRASEIILASSDRIQNLISQFSEELEQALHIRRTPQ